MESSTFRQRILPLLVFLTLIATSFARPIALQERDDVPDPQSPPLLKWQQYILAAFCIITGNYFCFVGYRFFRVTMFVVGMWFFGNIAFIVMANAGLANNTILLFVSIAIGIALGLLLAFCYQLGIYLLGALTGYTFALWILALKAGGLIPGHTFQIIFMIVLAVIGVVLSIYYERLLLIIATSFLGAFLITLGMEIVTLTGYGALLYGFLHGSDASTIATQSWKIYLMLGINIFIFLLGVGFQYKTSWKKVGADYRAGVPAGQGRCFGRRGKH